MVKKQHLQALRAGNETTTFFECGRSDRMCSRGMNPATPPKNGGASAQHATEAGRGAGWTPASSPSLGLKSPRKGGFEARKGACKSGGRVKCRSAGRSRQAQPGGPGEHLHLMRPQRPTLRGVGGGGFWPPPTAQRRACCCF